MSLGLPVLACSTAFAGLVADGFTIHQPAQGAAAKPIRQDLHGHTASL